MICSETREYLFAFLDSELDSPLSIELQRHAEHCHDCAREMEIERTIRRQLSANLDALSAEYELDEDALNLAMTGARALEGSGDSRRLKPAARLAAAVWHRFPTGVLLAAAAAILVVFTSLWIIGPRSDAGRSGERFAVLVVRDFEHFLEEGKELQITSTDPAVVADWLRARTHLDVTLLASKVPAFQLVGGRKCKIDGQAAAFAVFEIDGQPASLVGVADDDWNLEGMTSVDRTHKQDDSAASDVERDESGYWVESCKGYAIVAWKRSGLTYAVVSTVTTNELIDLMAGVLYEGD